jgi:pimeloyl-ACP methyl ester carboxylesterase
LVVLIHGRSQQGRAPDEIKDEWVNALRLGLGSRSDEFLSRTKIILPFYGDILEAFTLEMDEDLPADVILRSASTAPDAEFQEFAAAIAERLRDSLGITDAQIDEELTNGPIERGPQNWGWVQAIFKAADRLPGLSAHTIERVTRDVYLYLTRSKVRKAINGVVEDALGEGPVVIVGHSLGSVVGYDVLLNSPNATNVTDYITIGSPLAVGPIMRSFKPLKYPKQLRSWYNAYDDRDVVALYPLDNACFPVSGGRIENQDNIKNRTDNAHGISGYLCDPILANHLLEIVETG